jgi:hypothetical protein
MRNDAECQYFGDSALENFSHARSGWHDGIRALPLGPLKPLNMLLGEPPQKPIEGVSLLYCYSDAQAKSPHAVQYAEFAGNRGIYKDGWYALTLHRAPWESQPRTPFDQDKWELYNTAEDFSCANDLAAKNPEKLKEMQTAFLTEAALKRVQNEGFLLSGRVRSSSVSDSAKVRKPSLEDTLASLELENL